MCVRALLSKISFNFVPGLHVAAFYYKLLRHESVKSRAERQIHRFIKMSVSHHNARGRGRLKITHSVLLKTPNVGCYWIYRTVQPLTFPDPPRLLTARSECTPTKTTFQTFPKAFGCLRDPAAPLQAEEHRAHCGATFHRPKFSKHTSWRTSINTLSEHRVVPDKPTPRTAIVAHFQDNWPN